jgi:hypothetical protein
MTNDVGPPEARGRTFTSTTAAWFWTMGALKARQDGAPGAGTLDDILMVLTRLYQQRRITLEHGRILKIWGERGCPPDHRVPAERGDYRLWQEAMRALDFPLRNKGIVR